MNTMALMQLFATKTPFIILPAIFVIIGLSYTTYALVRFLTASDIPPHSAQPRYDFVYLGLRLVLAIGWTGFAIVFFLNILFAVANEIKSPHLMVLCWAIMALGLGLLFVSRLDMIIASSVYKASHASFPWRYFYQMQAKRFGSESPWRKNLQRFVASIFALVGALILGYFAFRFPVSVREIGNEINAIITDIQTSRIISVNK